MSFAATFLMNYVCVFMRANVFPSLMKAFVVAIT